MNYTEAKLKQYDGTIVPCRIQNSVSGYLWRKDGRDDIREVVVQRATYKFVGMKSYFWDFAGWEDGLKDRIIYELL